MRERKKGDKVNKKKTTTQITPKAWSTRNKPPKELTAIGVI